jgi:hypothetical protein
MNTKKTQFKRGALNKIRNNKAAWFTGTLAAAGIAVFIFAKSCGPVAEGPMPITPVRGDRICEQVEAYPYQLNNDGTPQMDSENHVVRNPYYSKEDCHRGDNVCDNNAEQVNDTEGNRITNLMSAFVDGTAIPSPLENEDSPDCIMQKVRETSCAEISEDRSNVISRDTRARVTGETDLGLRQRTRAEIAAMHADVTAVQLGNNYFVVENNYSESCDATLQMCTPESLEACYCPNHQDCVPDHCGNGRVERDQGEQCDSGSAAGRRACTGGTRCAGNCQCVERRRTPTPTVVRPPEAVCGNGTVEPGEECDPRAPASSCEASERCNSSCECEDRPPAQSNQCPGNSVPGTTSLISRITSQITSASGTLRNALQAEQSPVAISVRVNISASGVPTVAGASATCGGSPCSGSANIVSISGLNVAGIQTGSPSRECYIIVPVQLR